MKLIDDKKSAIKFVNTLVLATQTHSLCASPHLLTTTKNTTTQQSFAIKCVR